MLHYLRDFNALPAKGIVRHQNTRSPFTAPFNNMGTLKFKAQPILPASDYCRALFRCLNCAQRFDYCAFGRSWLGGAAEHLTDGSPEGAVNGHPYWPFNRSWTALCFYVCTIHAVKKNKQKLFPRKSYLQHAPDMLLLSHRWSYWPRQQLLLRSACRDCKRNPKKKNVFLVFWLIRQELFSGF